VIVVLSDANAAFSLPPDEKRQKIIWVDDFSQVEAKEYLDNAKFLLKKDEKRNQLFERIGTRAATLKQLVSEGFLNFNRRRTECGCVC
jgi:hypothetical protein